MRSHPAISGTVYRSNDLTVLKGSVLDDLGTTYSSASEVVTATGHNYFLRHIMNNNMVESSSFGFMHGGMDYYLVGGDEGAAFETNKSILLEVFGGDACTASDDDLFCEDGPIFIDVFSDGYIEGHDDTWTCFVYDDGSSLCQVYN